MDSSFRFKRFSVRNPSGVGQKVGTDGVLLGAGVSIESKENARVLDIGTGTGVVALMIAQRMADLSLTPVITALEIDEEAARIAALNFADSPWADCLKCLHQSLEEYSMDQAWEGNPLRFDLIVSNPPFFDSSLPAPDAARNTARHTDSLSYREIISFAHDFLAPGGRIALILPKDEEKRLRRFASSFGFKMTRLVNIHTTAAKPPKRMIAEFGFAAEVAREDVEELTLDSGDGHRSAEYSALTAEFYLD